MDFVLTVILTTGTGSLANLATFLTVSLHPDFVRGAFSFSRPNVTCVIVILTFAQPIVYVHIVNGNIRVSSLTNYPLYRELVPKSHIDVNLTNTLFPTHAFVSFFGEY